MSYEISILESNEVKHHKHKSHRFIFKHKHKKMSEENKREMESDIDSQIQSYPFGYGPIRTQWFNLPKLIPHRHKDYHPNEISTSSDESSDDEHEQDYYKYHFGQKGWNFHFPKNDVFLG
mmetsp:Transcript_19656/g.17411  ORF Transcript_19656/g.17411 Transcript_19656/m.17411 type:complete len:120 (+) Transcript_19656:40-399(+)